MKAVKPLGGLHDKKRYWSFRNGSGNLGSLLVSEDAEDKMRFSKAYLTRKCLCYIFVNYY